MSPLVAQDPRVTRGNVASRPKVAAAGDIYSTLKEDVEEAEIGPGGSVWASCFGLKSSLLNRPKIEIVVVWEMAAGA
jgi:hypothetical protein